MGNFYRGKTPKKLKNKLKKKLISHRITSHNFSHHRIFSHNFSHKFEYWEKYAKCDAMRFSHNFASHHRIIAYNDAICAHLCKKWGKYTFVFSPYKIEVCVDKWHWPIDFGRWWTQLSCVKEQNYRRDSRSFEESSQFSHYWDRAKNFKLGEGVIKIMQRKQDRK